MDAPRAQVFSDPKTVEYGGTPLVFSDYVGGSTGASTAAPCTETAVAIAVVEDFRAILKGAAANWPQTLNARVKLTKPEFPNASREYVLQELVNHMAQRLPQGFVARGYCQSTKRDEHEYVLYYHPADEEAAWKRLYQQRTVAIVSDIYSKRGHNGSGYGIDQLLAFAQDQWGLGWTPRGIQVSKIPGASYECTLSRLRVEPGRNAEYCETVTRGVLSVINSAPGLTAVVKGCGDGRYLNYGLTPDVGKLTVMGELQLALVDTVVQHLQELQLPARVDEWWSHEVSITIRHASIPVLMANNFCTRDDFSDLAGAVWTKLGFPQDPAGRGGCEARLVFDYRTSSVLTDQVSCRLWPLQGAWRKHFDDHVDAEVARIWEESFTGQGRTQAEGKIMPVRTLVPQKVAWEWLQGELTSLSEKHKAVRSPHVTQFTCELVESKRFPPLLAQRIKIGLDARAEKETRTYLRKQYKLEALVGGHFGGLRSDQLLCLWNKL